MTFRRTRIAFALAALVALAAGDRLRPDRRGAGAQEDQRRSQGQVADDEPLRVRRFRREDRCSIFSRNTRSPPEAAQAHYTLGRIYASTGAYENALRHFGDYIAMPGDKGGPEVIAQARFVMGSCYMALERYDEAERSFKLAMNVEGAAGSRAAGGRRRGAREDRGAAKAQDRRARDSHRGHVVPGTRRSAFRRITRARSSSSISGPRGATRAGWRCPTS